MFENILVQLRQKGIVARISGSTLWANCPYCIQRGTTKDTRQRLGIELRGRKVPVGTGWCFNCHYRSKNALEEILGQPINLLSVQEPERQEPEVKLPEDFELLNVRSPDHWNKVAFKYLMDRGMEYKEIVDYQVGLSMLGKTRNRVVFPVLRKSKLIGWTARTLADEEPKWLHSSGLRRAYWIRRKSKTVVLNEGVFDAVAVARVLKYSDAMAILGSNMTEEKMAEIKDFENVVIWLDPDSAGRKATVDIAERLAGENQNIFVVQASKYILSQHPKADPAELTREEILEVLRGRKPWNNTLSNSLLRGFVE